MVAGGAATSTVEKHIVIHKKKKFLDFFEIVNVLRSTNHNLTSFRGICVCVRGFPYVYQHLGTCIQTKVNDLSMGSGTV